MQICDVFPAIEGARVHIGSKWGIWLADLETSELQTHPQKHGTLTKFLLPMYQARTAFPWTFLTVPQTWNRCQSHWLEKSTNAFVYWPVKGRTNSFHILHFRSVCQMNQEKDELGEIAAFSLWHPALSRDFCRRQMLRIPKPSLWPCFQPPQSGCSLLHPRLQRDLPGEDAASHHPVAREVLPVSRPRDK